MSLSEDLVRIAAEAERFADREEELTGVLAAEPSRGERVYLCSFAFGAEQRSWLALDDDGRPVDKRSRVHDAVSILALCELAEDTAAGGDLDELLARVVSLRITEGPAGIEAAEDAVRELQRTVGSPPQIASPERLDEVGSATRRLEEALGQGGSPFAEAMKASTPSVEELTADIEANYKLGLD